jgi:hypothetical protein
MAEKHRVRNWRGARSSYEFLKSVNRLDPWTRYCVVETDGSISEYYGENLVVREAGQLLPVNAILSGMPSTNDVNPYDRFLVGEDGTGYEIVEFFPKATSDGTELVSESFDFDEKYGVRVKSQGLKNFVYVDGVLKTYDDVDCGLF